MAGGSALLLDLVGRAVEQTLFAITCLTCRARLNVRSRSAIGEILTCPKCGSMVEVVPPPGWEFTEESPEEPAGAEAAGAGAGLAGVARAAEQSAIETPPPEGHDTLSVSRGEPAHESAEATSSTPHPAPPPIVPPEPAGPSAASGAAPDAGALQAGEGAAWGMSPVAVAPAELLWRKWLILATAPLAGLVIGLTAWSLFWPRSVPESPPPAVVDRPHEPAPVVEEPVEEGPGPLLVPLDPRWLPEGTRLLVTLRASRLADREEFNLAVPLAGPTWQQTIGELLTGFGLKIETIRRLSWASTDLADWPDYGVMLVELEEGQDAGVFRVVSKPVEIELDGEPCRRLNKGGWPHPFAVLDELTIVTGREELLRELADRSEPLLASTPIDRLLAAASPEADAVTLLDLAAAREAGWRLPTSLMDVWPAGREPWHVVWEMPQGLGFSFRRGDRVLGEVALLCEGETAAKSVDAALGELIPAAKTVLHAQVESLTQRLEAGRLTAASADQYEVFLNGASTALGAARWDVEKETVWLRIDFGDDAAPLLAAGLGSRPAIRAEWLGAARIADEANYQRMLSGLDGYQRAEGHFPPGAGGGALLPPETRLSWIAMMLPYFGHRDWHRELDFGYSWNSPQNRPVTSRRLDAVVNPALGPKSTEAGFPVTHYVGVAGVGAGAGDLKPNDPRAGVFGHNRTTQMGDITDGASNTIAILGVIERLGAWAAGGSGTVRALTKPPYVNGPDGFGSGQPGGMLAGMADGSVRFLSSDIDPTVLEQLATIGGGEKVPAASLVSTGIPEPLTQPDNASPEPDTAAEEGPPADTGDAAQGLTVEEARVGAESEPAKVDVQARLADPLLEMGFADVPLADALKLLSQMSTLPITFDLDAMAELGVTIRDPVAVQVSDATTGKVLEAVLSNRGLTYVVEDDQILVTSPQRKRIALRAVPYTVSDLAGPEPAALSELAGLVQKLVAPESWRPAGGQGTVEPAEGVLRVVQTDPIHYQILTFCERLRAARGLPLRSQHDPNKFALATLLDRARAKLSEPVTANFHKPTPLVRIIADLEELTGTRILIDWLALQAQGMSPGVEGSLNCRDLPLSEVLDDLLRPMGLAYRVVDADTLEVTTRRTVAARLELEFHPVGDLLTEGATAASLMEGIKDQVAGATWSEAGGPGVLHFDQPSQCLIVLQAQPAQFELEELLERWRAERTPEEKEAQQ